MSDLISKEKIRHEIAMLIMNNNRLIDTWLANCIDDIIDEQPTIEAEPIKHGVIELTYEEYGELCSYALADELKHGEWLIDKSGSLMCSKCGTLLDEAQKPSRYCPNCGARMDLTE